MASADNRKAALKMVDSRRTATTTPDLQVWDTRQAAQAYGLSVSWLNKLRVSGGGCPYIKAGRRVLYRKSDFADWVASRVRTSTSDPGAKTAHQGRAA
jgi:Helix-turn-helix domain